MTFISMSVTTYVTHLVGALAVGIAIGVSAVYAVNKLANKQVDIKQKPVKEEKQLLVLENAN